MKLWTLVLGVVTFGHFVSVHGIQRRYVTQLCPGSVGPTHGEVVRFDPNFNNTQWVIPETDLDCYLTLRGMPTTDPTIPWYITLTWPGNYQFTVRGWDYANTGCDTAFIEIYLADVEGRPQGNPVLPRTCGDVRPGTLTSTNQAFVFRLYAEKEPVIPTTTTTPQPTPTPTPAPAAAVTAGAAATVATVATTAASVTTASTSTGNSTTTTGNSTTTGNNTNVPDTGGPFISFRADFTSYFMDCGADGIENDEEQLQCLNNRCVDMSLRCDRYGSNNCGDLGDQTVQPPGNCTVIPQEEPTDLTLLPLYIILGLLALLAILYWCCWRPGWCPWRLARCRNIKCCRKCCKSCRGKKCVSNGICGPAAGCFTRCTRGGCNRTKSGFPERKPDDNMDINNADSIQAWLTYAHDDGMHVREMR